MFDFGPYKEALGSFRFPVDPPTNGPFDDPKFQICVNQDWLPFIAGSLKQLLLQQTWPDTFTKSDFDTMTGKVFDLISAFGQVNPGCGVVPPSELCISGSFADLTYGFSSPISAVCPSTNVPGTGWESCVDTGTNKQTLDVVRTFDNATFVRSAQFRTASQIGVGYTRTVTFSFLGVPVYTHTDNIAPGGADTFTQNINQQADSVIITAVENSSGAVTHIVMDDWQICYTGDFPLSGVERFTHHFNFLLSDGGFVKDDLGGNSHCSWVSGQGWTATVQSPVVANDGAVVIGRITPRTLRHVSMTIVGTVPDGTNGYGVFYQTAAFPPAQSLIENYQGHNNGSFVFTHPFGSDMGFVGCYNQNGPTAGQTCFLTDCFVSADGTDPF